MFGWPSLRAPLGDIWDKVLIVRRATVPSEEGASRQRGGNYQSAASCSREQKQGRAWKGTHASVWLESIFSTKLNILNFSLSSILEPLPNFMGDGTSFDLNFYKLPPSPKLCAE